MPWLAKKESTSRNNDMTCSDSACAQLIVDGVGSPRIAPVACWLDLHVLSYAMCRQKEDQRRLKSRPKSPLIAILHVSNP